MTAPRNYLVMEAALIVAEDLALAIRDFDPAANVLLAPSPPAALEEIASAGQVWRAFVHADPAGFGATELGLALERRGARVVFIGDAAERSGRMDVLQRPFGSETVEVCLRQMLMAAS